jgi:hypothetical protein
LNNRPTTTTTNQTQSGTSTTARNLSPQQQILMNLMGPTISQMITNPMASLAPLETSARESVNQNYAGAPQAIRDQFMSSGGAASGKSGMATIAEQLGRTKDLSTVASNTESAAANRQLQALSAGENLLNTNLGQTTTGSSTGSGTTVQSGNEAGGALSAGLSSLTNLLGLLQGSGGSVGGGSPNLLSGTSGGYTPGSSSSGPASSSVSDAYFGGLTDT